MYIPIVSNAGVQLGVAPFVSVHRFNLVGIPIISNLDVRFGGTVTPQLVRLYRRFLTGGPFSY